MMKIKSLIFVMQPLCTGIAQNSAAKQLWGNRGTASAAQSQAKLMTAL